MRPVVYKNISERYSSTSCAWKVPYKVQERSSSAPRVGRRRPATDVRTQLKGYWESGTRGGSYDGFDFALID